MEQLLTPPQSSTVFPTVTLSSYQDLSSQPIVVFSHLRWNSVTQRPQHLLKRLSAHHPILFVEEPIDHDAKEKGTAKIEQVEENITLLQPRISWENMSQELVPILEEQFLEMGISDPILWFYSPMFIDVADSLSYSKIVYDCMDELSAFLGAPQSLLSKEEKLLQLSDVVFTGGKSLYESKRQRHANVHCFPSSVDEKHFKKVFKSSTPIPADISTIKPPVVGFYGVVDERLDLDLIDQIALKRPEVSFVIIGPVVKINPASLPVRKNIHYLGKKEYAELPSYLKAFDIAMMPFALNDATRFISPTKTLEFMAAKKPIISTAIYDVVRDYRDVVSIVSTVEAFSNAITAYLEETESQCSNRERKQEAVIAKTSWDRTASAMRDLISVESIATKSYVAPALSYTT
ncbi:glycosyltransferase [Candidatus Woesebacteria bacterium]|nr:glycosyltransferase [Candidatus Woesebacteria bacterium]